VEVKLKQMCKIESKSKVDKRSKGKWAMNKVE
jgi:hypothetical protein